MDIKNVFEKLNVNIFEVFINLSDQKKYDFISSKDNNKIKIGNIVFCDTCYGLKLGIVVNIKKESVFSKERLKECTLLNLKLTESLKEINDIKNLINSVKEV